MREVLQEDAAQAAADSRAAIEAIEPSSSPEAMERVLEFHWTHPDGVQKVDRKYTQAELGMGATQEFVTLLTETLNSFVEGEQGMKLGELFRGEVERPVDLNAEAVDNFVAENIEIFRAFLKAVRMLPEFQQEILVLSLGVPRREREWAKQQLWEAPSRGGLTVQEGFDLLIVFIRQNARMVRRELLGKASELVDVFRLEVLQQKPKDEDSSSTSSEKSSETTISEPSASPGGTPSTTSSPATLESV